MKRILYAKMMLQKEFLPHVGQDEASETLKGFFLGYTCHKMLMCALGRADEDDRDHYGAWPHRLTSRYRYIRGRLRSCRLKPLALFTRLQARSAWTLPAC